MDPTRSGLNFIKATLIELTKDILWRSCSDVLYEPTAYRIRLRGKLSLGKMLPVTLGILHTQAPFFFLAHLWWVANQVELGNAQTHSGQHSFQAELKILSFFHVTGW